MNQFFFIALIYIFKYTLYVYVKKQKQINNKSQIYKLKMTSPNFVETV